MQHIILNNIYLKFKKYDVVYRLFNVFTIVAK